ncbi:MAG: hypothetical protein AAGF12_13820 [Myxococcota bacterium]
MIRVGALMVLACGCTGIEVGNPPVQPVGPVSDDTGVDPDRSDVRPNMATGAIPYFLDVPTGDEVRRAALSPVDSSRTEPQRLVPLEGQITFAVDLGRVRLQLERSDGRLSPIDLEIREDGTTPLAPSTLFDCLGLPRYAGFRAGQLPVELEAVNRCAEALTIRRWELVPADTGFVVELIDDRWELEQPRRIVVRGSPSSDAEALLLLELEGSGGAELLPITLHQLPD